jgi:hypothetical protein
MCTWVALCTFNDILIAYIYIYINIYKIRCWIDFGVKKRLNLFQGLRFNYFILLNFNACCTCSG